MRIAVLGSTRGTVLNSLVNSQLKGELEAEIKVVISNKADALILEKAKSWNIPSIFVDSKNLTREAFEENLSLVLSEYKTDLIVLLGFMRILSPSFVANWEKKIINIHPSLLPKFAGLKDLAVHQAVLDAKENMSGCTVHYVIAEVDAGEIVLQTSSEILPTDNAHSLKERVQALEGNLLIAAINKIKKER